MYIHKAAALAAAVLLTGRVLGAPIPGESPSNEEKSASTIANSADSTVSESKPAPIEMMMKRMHPAHTRPVEVAGVSSLPTEPTYIL